MRLNVPAQSLSTVTVASVEDARKALPRFRPGARARSQVGERHLRESATPLGEGLEEEFGAIGGQAADLAVALAISGGGHRAGNFGMGVMLGLERLRPVHARLSSMPPDCRVITVAGTNGKGSCVAVAEAVALASGLRVGAYTSPHLFRYNERVRLDGQPVDDLRLMQAFESVVRDGENPIAQEFSVFLQQTRVGVSFANALENMERRVGSRDLTLVVNAIEVEVGYAQLDTELGRSSGCRQQQALI